MADRYWRGGTGTWSTSTTNWSASSGGAGGASAPTAADSVFFDQAGTYTVTMTGALTCLDITVSAGTVTFATGSAPTLAVSGSMSLVAGTVWNSTGTTTFNATTTGKTVTTNGVVFSGAVTFNGSGGAWTLGSALTTSATSTTTLTRGTLNLGNFTLTTGIFSSSNGNTRSVAFGSGNIALVHTTAATTVLSMSDAYAFSWTGTGGFTADAAITRTYTFANVGGSAGPNLTLTGSGTAVATLTTNSYFATLDFGSTACAVATTTLNLNSLTLSAAGTYTGLTAQMRGTGTITPNGKTIAALTINIFSGTTTLAGVLSTAATGTTTLTSGTLALAGFTLTTGIFNSTGDGGSVARSVAFGSSSIALVHTTPGTSVLGIGDARGFSCTGSGGFTADADITRTYTVGSSFANVGQVGPNLTFTGSGTAVATLATGSYFTTLDFGTTAFILGSTSLNLNSLTLSSGGTYTSLTATMVGTGTVTPNGKTIAALTINNSSGTTTLAGALSTAVTATTTLSSGTLALAGFTLTTGIFNASNSTTRSIAFGSGSIALVHPTAATTVLNMATATGLTCTGTGGFTADAAITRTYSVASSSFNLATSDAPNLTLTGSGTAVATLTNNSFFNTVNFGTTAFTVATTNLLLGGLTLSAGGTYTSLSAYMRGTGTVTGNGKTISIFDINHSGTTTLAAALSTSGTTTLNSGTLDLAGFTLTTPIFSSSNSTTRSIAFGSGSIVLNSGVSATTVLNMATATNFTWTGTGGFTADAATTRTYTFGTTSGSAANAPNLSIISGAVSPTLTDGSWFNALNFTGSTCTVTVSASSIGIYISTLTLATGGAYTALIPVFTRTQTWTAQFSKQLGGIGVNGAGVTLTLDGTQTYTATSNFYLTQGTLDLGGSNLTIGNFQTSGSLTRSIAFGANNIALTGTTGYVLYATGITNLTWTGTGLFTTTAATAKSYLWDPFGTSVTYAPNLSITSGSSTQTFYEASSFNSLNFTGSTCPVVNEVSSANNGIRVSTLTLATGGTYTGFAPAFTRTQTWTAQFSKQLGGIGVGAVGVTVTLDATQTYSATSACYLHAGTLDLGGVNLTVGSLRGSNSNIRSIAFGSNNIVLATTTAAVTVVSMATATGFTWTGTGGLVSNASVTRTFTFGTTDGSTTNAPNLSITSGAAVPTFTNGSWFKALNFTGSTCTPAMTALTSGIYVDTLTLATGGTYTGFTPVFTRTQTWTAQFSKQLGGIGVGAVGATVTLDATQTYTATSSCLVLAGTLDLGGVNLTVGIFNSNSLNTRSVAFGSNNIVLAHTTAGTSVLNVQTATNFTWTGTGGFVSDAAITRTYRFGTTAGGTSANAPNLSITSGAAVATLAAGAWFNVLNFTGSTGAPSSGVGIYVSTLILDSGGTYTALFPEFTRTQTWTAQFSKQLNGIGVYGAGVTLTLDGTQTYTATAVCEVLAGTLDLGGANLTIGRFYANSNTSIAFGSNNIVLATTTAGTTVLNVPDATGVTWTGTGGFVSDASITRTYTFGTTGGSTTNAPNLSITSGAAVPTFTDGSWFKSLNFTGTTSTPAMSATALGIYVDTLTLATGGTYTSFIPVFTRTQTWTAQFSKQLGGIGVGAVGVTLTLDATQTYTATSSFILTAGTLDLGGVTQTFGIFSSNNSNTRAIAFGNFNITLAHSSAGTTVLNVATATGFTWTGTGGFRADAAVTRTYTFGTTGGSTTNAPNLTFTGSGTQVATFTTGSWFNALNFGSTEFNPGTTTLNVNSLTLGPFLGSIYTGLTAQMRGTGTVNSRGKTIANFDINHAGTTTLSTNSLTVSSGTTLTAGTLALAGLTLTTPVFNSGAAAARSISGSGTISVSGAWTVSDGAGFTGSDYTVNMTSSSAKSFAGAGGSYGTLVQAGAGALTVSGSNAFADIRATTRPSTISFAAGTTQTVSAFTLSGISGSLVTINSVTQGSQFTLSKSSGTVIVSYLSIQDSDVTGGAEWYNNNGTNTVLTNNTGWSGQPAPVSTVNGQFMAFF